MSRGNLFLITASLREATYYIHSVISIWVDSLMWKYYQTWHLYLSKRKCLTCTQFTFTLFTMVVTGILSIFHNYFWIMNQCCLGNFFLGFVDCFPKRFPKVGWTNVNILFHWQAKCQNEKAPNCWMRIEVGQSHCQNDWWDRVTPARTHGLYRFQAKHYGPQST